MRTLVLAACFVIGCSNENGLPQNEIISTHAIGALRSDGQSLYYMLQPSSGPLELWRVGISDRTATRIAVLESEIGTSDQLVPFGIDSDFAYIPINGQLYKVPLSGGAPEMLADVGPQSWITAIAVGSDDIYFSVGVMMYSSSQGLLGVPKTGGTPGVLGQTNNTSAWNIRELATSGKTVYMPATSDIAHANDVIVAVNADTGVVTTIASGQARPVATAISGANVFWLDLGAGDGSFGGTANSSSGDIMSCDTVNVCVPSEIATDLALPSDPGAGVVRSTLVAPTDGTVLWNDATGLHEAGTTTATIDIAHGDVRLFTVDATNVYWANDEGIFFHPR